ncbi:MAG: hypothetical protein C0618_03775, partial [Desulfuromonas sp.]
MAWFRGLRVGSRFSLKSKMYALLAELELTRGDHEALTKVANILLDGCDSPHGYYYLAQSQFLCGDYHACRQSLLFFLQRKPNHPDAVYLLVNAYELLDKREAAWNSLEQLALVSRRLKTWLVMANLVRTAEDYDRLVENWRRAQKTGQAPLFHKDVNEYIANGALRSGNYEEARKIWRETLLGLASAKDGFSKLKPAKVNYSTGRAEAALIALRRVLLDAGIQMFLVSGTLLGCVREGRLLGHDKDIDVGIWEDVPQDLLLSSLRTSGLFYIQASRSPEIIRIKHVNGVAIDVFYHYREEGDCWHGGV